MGRRFKKNCRIAFLLSFVFFVSCEKDLYNEPIHSEKSNIIMRDFSINELSNKSNSKLLEKVNELKNRNRQQRQHQDGKIVYDSINDFYFDDESGKYIKKGDAKSYVFPVYRLNGDSKIEKVIFSELADGDYKMYLAKYKLTDDELKLLTQQEAATKDVEYTDITNKFGIQLGLMCFQTWEYLNTGELVGADGHAQYEWVVTGDRCFAINAEQSTDMGGSGNGDVSQGGGVILSSPSGNGAPLTPNQFHAIVHSEFLSMMSDEQHNWWINPVNASSAANITHYLTTHNYSSANENFVYEMIDMCIANHSNFTFSNSVNSTNAQVFNTISEFQDYMNNFQNQLCSDVDLIDDVIDPTKKTANGTFHFSLFFNVTEHINQNIKTPTQPWNLNSITFDTSGLTLGTSWTQTSVDDPISIIGDVATFTLTGYMHLNAFIGGYGNFFTKSIRILIKVDTTTGQIIYGEAIEN